MSRDLDITLKMLTRAAELRTRLNLEWAAWQNQAGHTPGCSVLICNAVEA